MTDAARTPAERAALVERLLVFVFGHDGKPVHPVLCSEAAAQLRADGERIAALETVLRECQEELAYLLAGCDVSSRTHTAEERARALLAGEGTSPTAAHGAAPSRR